MVKPKAANEICFSEKLWTKKLKMQRGIYVYRHGSSEEYILVQYDPEKVEEKRYYVLGGFIRVDRVEVVPSWGDATRVHHPSLDAIKETGYARVLNFKF